MTSRKSTYPWWNEAKWKAVTPIVKQRDDYACVSCGSVGSDNKVNPLTVDHIYPLSLFNDDEIKSDLAYDPNNLETLCNYCNGMKQNKLNVRQNWKDESWFQ